MSTAGAPQITPKTQYVLVLWGDKFDEDMAALFTKEARRAGLCVKVIGVNGIQAAGRNGLILAADLTLSQALLLPDSAICVVVPCSPAMLLRIEDDPRIPTFFRQANARQAFFVVSHRDAIVRSSLADLQIDSARLAFYSDDLNLSGFVHQIVRFLTTNLATT